MASLGEALEQNQHSWIKLASADFKMPEWRDSQSQEEYNYRTIYYALLSDFYPQVIPIAHGARPLPPGLFERFLNELHDFLCSGERYREEREHLTNDLKAGQTTFVASVATAISPYIGAASPMLTTGVAVSLTIIGQVGLRAWCAQQADRRTRREKGEDDGLPPQHFTGTDPHEQ